MADPDILHDAKALAKAVELHNNLSNMLAKLLLMMPGLSQEERIICAESVIVGVIGALTENQVGRAVVLSCITLGALERLSPDVGLPHFIFMLNDDNGTKRH